LSLISSTVLPISCELSPSRLMRLLVSWMVSRIAFMPSIVRRTALAALVRERSTEWARDVGRRARRCRRLLRSRAAIAAIDSVAEAICLVCTPLALPSCAPSACVWARGRVHLNGRGIDRGDQLAQRLDRVGSPNRRFAAGDVLGHGRLHGQIAVGQARHLVEQLEDRTLVCARSPAAASPVACSWAFQRRGAAH